MKNFPISNYSENHFFEKKIGKIVFFLSCYALVSILVNFIIGYFFQKNKDDIYLLSYLPFFILTIYLNYIGKSLVAFSLIFTYSAAILSYFSITQGEASATHFHFANNLVGLSLLYSNPKAKKHFYYSLFITLLAISFVILSFYNEWFLNLQVEISSPFNTRLLNFILLLFSAIVFSIVLVNLFNYQQKELKYALEEQKTLLAEINHRVKNNMTIIVSLINLKKDQCTNSESKEALIECKNRIMAMALVHQKIYNSKNKNNVELGSYINELVKELQYALEIKYEINIKTTIDSLNINVNTAIPLGLILNELITNSFKHAFLDVEKPEITIEINKQNNGNLKLVYTDNGKGFNPNEINEESLGISLIGALSEQLSGVYSFNNNVKLEFTLIFKES